MDELANVDELMRFFKQHSIAFVTEETTMKICVEKNTLTSKVIEGRISGIKDIFASATDPGKIFLRVALHQETAEAFG